MRAPLQTPLTKASLMLEPFHILTHTAAKTILTIPGDQRAELTVVPSRPRGFPRASRPSGGPSFMDRSLCTFPLPSTIASRQS